MEALATATAVNPENPQAHTLLGTVWRNQGQMSKSVGALERALPLDPRAWLAHVELGKYGSQPGASRKLTAMLARRTR